MLLFGCAHNAGRRDAAPSFGGKGTVQPVLPLVRDYVYRDETLATAIWFTEVPWVPRPANVFHGEASDGVRVDTPDSVFVGPDERSGWVIGEIHRGLPYHWGGFSTPDEFLAGLEAGRPVGDMYTTFKRAKLYDAVSKIPVGIDCSGFVSRCWKLPKPYSTRSLPSLCEPLTSYAELKAGDILNLYNNHVLLFDCFADGDQKEIIAYEAGSPVSFHVGRHSMKAHRLKELGYMPYRYRGIRDRPGK